MKKILTLMFLITFFLAYKNAYAVIFEWPVLDGGNGNYYDLVPLSGSTQTWQESLAEADGLTYLGLPGHLATITSANENAFLNSKFNNGLGSQFAWFAGFEPNDDGIWKWATGPETGIQFSNGVTATPPFNYANWGGIEPNDNKPLEDFAMFNIGTTFASINPGQWADASPTPSSFDPVVGYLVEYEAQGQSAAIPEPSSLWMLAFALAGIAATKKFHKFIPSI